MRMRDILTIIETKQKTFFHGSKKRLVPGTKLRPGVSHSEQEEKAVEEILEHFRPEICLPRAQSVFLVEYPDADLIERVGGYATFIYEVLPLRPFEKNDVHWWAEILLSGAYDYADGDTSILADATVKKIANAYWAGTASDHPAWEIRSSGAQVLREIS